jgi:hypothetical protein
MFSLINKFLFSSFVFSLIFFVPSVPAFAQSKDADVQGAASMGVARMVDTVEKNVKEGSILSSSEKGVVLSVVPYDSQVVGVVSPNAAIVLSSNSDSGVPVISVGAVYVFVSSKEGPIKKGDRITTSTIPGVGVKAVKSGYTLGTALEDYNSSDPKEVGKIAVDFNLSYFNSKPTLAGSLSDVLKVALLSTKDSPSPIFKYIIAGGVAIASFVLGFLTFGRTAAKGVEALGRNPAAGKIIHLGIIFNVGIVIAIVIGGLAVAFLILRL